jgi:two-component system, OmpR family, phosphate regulon sensor histidine kinase PhoR
LFQIDLYLNNCKRIVKVAKSFNLYSKFDVNSLFQFNMRTRHIRIVTVMAIASIVGIMLMQVIWFKQAYDLKQRQFNHTVYLALQNVAEQILTFNKIHEPLGGLVNQISTNYYAVNVNGEIETTVLEFLLKTEFEKRNILVDFEYGVYNCASNKMVYGNYVSMRDKPSKNKKSELPLWQQDKYYFCVLFPETTMYIASQMGIWLFFNGILIVICIFFGYALLIILRQKRYSEVQKDFINNMTHELKTPITTILVSTGLINKQEIYQEPDYVLKYNEIISREANRLKGQVDKVLQIALFDKEKVNFKFEDFNVHQYMNDMQDSFNLMLADKHGAISLQLNATNPIIKADPVHMTNVIHNLVDNAIKYCSKNPEIVISTANIKKKLVLGIKDNGIGISKKDLERVFEKFYRVPTGNIHTVKGFGLGLYYVKTVITGHKGTLEIVSELGKGSDIMMYLPLANNS